MDNYSRITSERLRAWDADAGRVHDPKRYYPISHGHSLYFNTLAERGVFGSITLAAVLVAWGVALIRRRPGRSDPDDDWLIWGCAAAAWTVTVAVGTVNTTLHDEHAILAVLLLGLWLSRHPLAESQRPEPRV
jgi:O-antigen ligase